MLAGDLVVRVGDKPILGRTDLMREIGLLAPGTRVNVKVWRPVPGREVDLPIEVGKWPAVDDEGIIVSRKLRDAWRGIQYDYATARQRIFDITERNVEMHNSVVVMEVEPNSPAAAARDLQPLDRITHVKGRPVKSPREFAEAVQGETGPVTLTIWRQGNQPSGLRQIEIKAR